MSLRALSDSIILSRTRELTRRERSLTLQVLLHLNEIERRKLHLKLGYASMFVYCTSGLGYSASAAARRIRTARCVAQFPDVLPLLEANRVNLTTIAEASRVLRPQNQDEILARIDGKSQDQVRAIVAEYQPRALPRETVRPVAVVTAPRVAAGAMPLREPVAAAAVEATLPARGRESTAVSAAQAEKPAPTCDTPASGADACEKSAYCRSGSDTPPVSGTEHGEAVRGSASAEVCYHVSLTATPEFMAKLNTIRALACYRLPRHATLAQVIELVMDAYIEREHPAARRARRERRAAGVSVKTKTLPATPRHPGARIPIAAAVKDDVFVRDHGQCSYVGTDGRLCGTRHGLQIDHVQPVARGGGNGPGNLRLLCAHHNRLEAERVLGPWPPGDGTRYASPHALPLRE